MAERAKLLTFRRIFCKIKAYLTMVPFCDKVHSYVNIIEAERANAIKLTINKEYKKQ